MIAWMSNDLITFKRQNIGVETSLTKTASVNDDKGMSLRIVKL